MGRLLPHSNVEIRRAQTLSIDLAEKSRPWCVLASQPTQWQETGRALH
jgi:hypothetical protein